MLNKEVIYVKDFIHVTFVQTFNDSSTIISYQTLHYGPYNYLVYHNEVNKMSFKDFKTVTIASEFAHISYLT